MCYNLHTAQMMNTLAMCNLILIQQLHQTDTGLRLACISYYKQCVQGH